MASITKDPPPAYSAEALVQWERRLEAWSLLAVAVNDADMRALYCCGVSCAEKIVRQLRRDAQREGAPVAP